MKGDAETIAKGLTKAQRDALPYFYNTESWFSAWSLGINSSTCEALYRRGLLRRDRQTVSCALYGLTPLGLEVRHLLEGADNGKD